MKHARKYILAAACCGLITLSFNCDLFTGPHNGGGSDTTSHAWTFEVDTLGDGASQLYDVAIVSINPPLAYAVGEINTQDSAGSWKNPPYNLAIWDGKKWSLSTVLYMSQGQGFFSSIQSICVFGANDIWFEAGIRWDGHQYISAPMGIDFPSHVNKMWGTSDHDLYAVGNNGLLAHRDASGSWQLFNTNTTLDIRDIWGSGGEILAVASNDEGSTLLSIRGTTVTPVSDSALGASLYGVWFVPNQKYYAVGPGIFWKYRITDPVWNTYAPGVVTSYLSGGVRGNDTSDVFVTGAGYEIVHYNGRSWRNYRNEVSASDGGLARLAIQGNLMIAVGFSSTLQKAIAISGRRN